MRLNAKTWLRATHPADIESHLVSYQRSEVKTKWRLRKNCLSSNRTFNCKLMLAWLRSTRCQNTIYCLFANWTIAKYFRMLNGLGKWERHGWTVTSSKRTVYKIWLFMFVKECKNFWLRWKYVRNVCCNSGSRTSPRGHNRITIVTVPKAAGGDLFVYFLNLFLKPSIWLR